MQGKHFLLMTQAFLFIIEKVFAENLVKMAPNLSNLTQVSTFINFNETLGFFSLLIYLKAGGSPMRNLV